jgi:hypothetical protein
MLAWSATSRQRLRGDWPATETKNTEREIVASSSRGERCGNCVAAGGKGVWFRKRNQRPNGSLSRRASPGNCKISGDLLSRQPLTFLPGWWDTNNTREVATPSTSSLSSPWVEEPLGGRYPHRNTRFGNWEMSSPSPARRRQAVQRAARRRVNRCPIVFCGAMYRQRSVLAGQLPKLANLI